MTKRLWITKNNSLIVKEDKKNIKYNILNKIKTKTE